MFHISRSKSRHDHRVCISYVVQRTPKPDDPVYLRGTLEYQYDNNNDLVTMDPQSRVLHVGTSSVTDRLVGDGEFTEVVTGHLWLDLDGGERLSVLVRQRNPLH